MDRRRSPGRCAHARRAWICAATGRGTAPLSRQHLEATEYYDPLNAELFVFFDSLADLQRKLAETDYAVREVRLRAWTERHTNTTSQRWQTLSTFLIGERTGGPSEVEGSGQGGDRAD